MVSLLKLVFMCFSNLVTTLPVSQQAEAVSRFTVAFQDRFRELTKGDSVVTTAVFNAQEDRSMDSVGTGKKAYIV